MRRRPGGDGRARGGDGLRKRLRFLAPARVSFIAGRQGAGPWGLAGGRAGEPGSARLRPAGAGRDRPLAGKVALDVEAGAELEVRTPGGGGYGRPTRRRRADR